MINKLQNNKLFFLEGIKNIKQTGSFIPSSSFLCDGITKFVNSNCKSPVNVLEVGSGIGTFTGKIIKKLNSNDVIDLVEINANFCNILHEKFVLSSAGQGENKKKPNVNLINSDILSYETSKQYDYIVCSIPINNLSYKDFKELFLKLGSKCLTGGIFSFYEYIGTSFLMKLLRLHKDKGNSHREQIKKWIQSHLYEKEFVYLNITPAKICHLKF